MNPSPPTPALSPLLRVRDLCVRHATADGGTETVSGVAFDVPAGGAVGIVGESGSGKSQTALALIGLHGPSTRVQGSIRFDGDELLALDPAAFRRLRGARIGTVFRNGIENRHHLRVPRHIISRPAFFRTFSQNLTILHHHSTDTTLAMLPGNLRQPITFL